MGHKKKNDDIKEYVLYKDFLMFKTISLEDDLEEYIKNDRIYFIDKDVKLNKEYTYEIQVIDLNYNKSPKILQKIILKDNAPPLFLKDINITTLDKSVVINWTNNSNYYDVKEYILLRKNEKEEWITVSVINYIDNKKYEYIDSGLENGEIYRYKIEVVDFVGNVSINNTIISGSPYDTPKITNFNVQAGNEQATLSWDKSVSGKFSLYVINRTPFVNSDNHGTIIGTNSKLDFPIYISNINTTTFVDYSLKNDVEYTYSILEIDNTYNKSPEETKKTTPTKQLEEDFSNIEFNNSESTLNSLTLSWNDTLYNNFVVYKIYINKKLGQRLFVLKNKTIGNNQYTIGDLVNNTSYNIQIIEINNKKFITNIYYFKGTPIDIPPQTPQNISCIPSKTQVYLSWNKNTETDIKEYQIFKQDKLIQKVGPNVIEWRDFDVELGDDYNYYVVACDKGHNKSKKSEIVSCKIEEVVGPPKKPKNIVIEPKKKSLGLIFEKNNEKDLKLYKIYKNSFFYDYIYKIQDNYYNKNIIAYDNQLHSSFKNGGVTGLDRSLSEYWKGNLNDSGWIGDINKPETLKKGIITYDSVHWIQFDLQNIEDVMGFIYKPITKLVYNKKISIKMSKNSNDWDNQHWIEIDTNTTELTLKQPTKKEEKVYFFPNKIKGQYVRIYILDFENEPGGHFTIIYNLNYNINKIKYIDRNVLLGTQYKYSISAVDIYNQESEKSTNIISSPIDKDPGKPGFPLNFKGIEKNQKTILNWDKNNESDVKFYYIYRSEDGNDFVLLYKLDDNSAEIKKYNNVYEIQDKNLTNDKIYKYKITAVDDDFNESLTSEELELTPRNAVPHIPKEMRLIPGFNSIKLIWRENDDDDIQKYKIYKGTTKDIQHVYDINKNNWSLLNGYICFTDINVINGTTYFYSIKAVDDTNQESNSNQKVSVVPQDNPPQKPVIKNIVNRDNYLSINIELNVIEFDIFSYVLYRSLNDIDYQIVNIIYSDYYIINLPLKNYIVSSFKITDDTNYNDPRINFFKSSTINYWMSNDTSPYLELLIPETERNKTIVGLAIQGINNLNYPRKFKFKTTTTNSYLAEWESFDNDSLFVENEYNMSNTFFRVFFKNKKTNIKKIRIEPFDDVNSWKGANFSMKCALIVEYDLIDKNILYNDYDLKNGTKYFYRLKSKDKKNNVSEFSDTVSSIPTDFLPPPIIKELFVKNYYKNVELTWNKSQDERFSFYKIYKNNIFVSKTIMPKYVDMNIKNGINYSYSVSSVDIYNNESARSKEVIGSSTILKVPVITVENVSHNSVSFRCSIFNYTDLNPPKIVYKVSYRGIDTKEKIIEKNNNSINLVDLIPETEYEIRVKFIVDNIESDYSKKKKIKTTKKFSLLSEISNINNFNYIVQDNNIILNWDKNNNWDIKEYFITLKKGIGKESILNIEDIIVDKNTDTYIITNFDWDTNYEIKIYSRMLSNIISNPAVLNFDTPIDPDIVNFNTIKTKIDDIKKNINNFTISAIENSILDIQMFKHNKLTEEIQDTMNILQNRKIYLISLQETNNIINKINYLLNNSNSETEIDDFIKSISKFKPNEDIKLNYKFRLNILINKLNDLEMKNNTQKNIDNMNEILLNGEFDDFNSNYNTFFNFKPHADSASIYNNLLISFKEKLDVLKINVDTKQKTTEYINKMRKSVKTDDELDINGLSTLLNEINQHEPFTDLKIQFDDEKNNLIDKLNELKLKETTKLIWLSKNIEKRKIINYSYNRSLIRWENENTKGLIINVLRVDNDIVYFDWLDIANYVKHYSYLSENIKLNELMNSFVLTVDNVRYISKYRGYKTFQKNINMKFTRLLNNKYTGKAQILNSNETDTFIIGDLLTIGNKWIYECFPLTNTIIHKSYIFEDIQNELKTNGVLRNSFNEFTFVNEDVDLQQKNDIYFKFISYVNYENSLLTKNTVNIKGKTKNTIKLSNSIITFPNKNVKLTIPIKSISFWMKNWNSTKLFTYKNISILKNSKIPSEFRVFDENGDTITINSTNKNIHNNPEWVFIYIEFVSEINDLNEDDIEINFKDGNIELGEIIFYKKYLSFEQIQYISESDNTIYRISNKKNINITTYANTFFNSSINNYNDSIIGKKNINYISTFIDSNFNTVLTKKWKYINGTFNKRLIIPNDLYSVSGFDDLFYSLEIAELYPQCVGVSKINGKFYLMQLELEQTVNITGEKSWQLIDYKTSDHNWEKFVLNIKNNDSKLVLELPSINILDEIHEKNINVILNDLYYLVFAENSILLDLVKNNNIEILDLKSTISITKTPVDLYINNDGWVDIIDNVIQGKTSTIFKITYNSKDYYILFKFVYKMIDFPIDIIFNTIVN